MPDQHFLLEALAIRALTDDLVELVETGVSPATLPARVRPLIAALLHAAGAALPVYASAHALRLTAPYGSPRMIALLRRKLPGETAQHLLDHLRGLAEPLPGAALEAMALEVIPWLDSLELSALVQINHDRCRKGKTACL